MKGKIKFFAKNKHITFSFTLERNVTILTGDSGTGKSKLINMIRDYAEYGKSSGVTIRCDKPCIVLEGKAWEQVLEGTHESIVFVEESSHFLTSHDFAKAIQESDNYYVLVTRESLPQISYSIDAIKQIVKNSSKPKLDRLYKNISVDTISQFPYGIIIVEDSKAGFQLFTKAAEKWNVTCVSSNEKSSILPLLKKYYKKDVLVIADAAALGSEVRELVRYKEVTKRKVDFFLPESFEWLILKSSTFTGNTNIQTILSDPIAYIESKEFFSWERYFTYLLIEETKDRPQLKYEKAKLAAGYQTEANIESIINAMKNP